MTDQSSNQTPAQPASSPVGPGKITAAILAGALSTIVLTVLANTGVNVSVDLASAVQTVFTCLLVMFVPHNLWSGQ